MASKESDRRLAQVGRGEEGAIKKVLPASANTHPI